MLGAARTQTLALRGAAKRTVGAATAACALEGHASPTSLLASGDRVSGHEQRRSNFTVIRGKVRPGFQDYPRRTGVLAMKIGMLPDWDDHGRRLGLTVLQIQGCYVVEQKFDEATGYHGLVLGAGDTKAKHINKPQQGVYEKAGLPLRRHMGEFDVDEECLLPVGTELTARHFVPGQYVDVQAKSIGKGTQGVMRRWGFKGQPASHGTSLSHRSPGSIGVTGMSRVWKGKKMAGKTGNKKRTVSSLAVFKIDTERNLLYLYGNVPGNKGGIVRVRDAFFKPNLLWNGEQTEYPMPTWTPPTDEAALEELAAADTVLKAPPLNFNPLERTFAIRA
ncbi:50S ribosomal protein L3, chloroplastic [Hondaea fermentalgiana]|uniref:Large ribosomal subunit protein uL3m n=1 Tax=Hondaea fermentalgiana TaxID=2315210 RepID=A0A2R5GMR4_9STRA|nr:50S ribosomal protein L3, chloroplastic [Hondaea fermentalgiana]|eukprot:GBG32177.1 50S ribosomal protein L3, chloroplastic [Hondaea fermentalgiana]